MPAVFEIPREKWTGSVAEVTLGATDAEGGTRSKTVTVGRETTFPFLYFEGEMPHRPVVAIEIQDAYPGDWSPLLLKAWGDDVLRDLALRVKRSIRGIDLACRTGGEEFVIVMPETDMAVAAMVAERLRRRIAAEPFPINQGQRTIPVTLSIGIAALRGEDDNAASLLKRADQALYRAKRDGRNRVVPDAA